MPKKELLIDCVFYDIEIANCIPDKGKPKEPDLVYCEGWEDYYGMGLGVVGTFDTRSRDVRVYRKESLDEFKKLVEGRLVVGFNNENFDDKLMKAFGVEFARSRDFQSLTREALGEPAHYVRGVTKAGRKLGDWAYVNGLGSKLLSGTLAPVLLQRGEWWTVVNYVIDDVMKTARLTQKAVLRGVHDPLNTNRIVKIGWRPADQ